MNYSTVWLAAIFLKVSAALDIRKSENMVGIFELKVLSLLAQSIHLYNPDSNLRKKGRMQLLESSE